MKLKLSTNLIFQGAALIVQYGNQTSRLVPLKYQTFVALAVGVAQALVAWKAHNVNQDGSPAAVAYRP